MKNILVLILLIVVLIGCTLKQYQTPGEAIQLGYDMYPECYPQGAIQGIKYFQKALEMEPDNIYAYAGIANAHICLFEFSNNVEDIKASEINLKKAMDINSDDPYVLNMLAEVYFYMEQYEQCLEYAGKAIQVNDEYPDAYQTSGLCYEATNQKDKQESDFKTYKDLMKRYDTLKKVRYF